MPTPDLPADGYRILFQSPLVQIHSVRCSPEWPEFRDPGPVQKHVFVFPRTAVWMRPEGQPPFVADPGLVTFYNAGDLVTREPLWSHGDQYEGFCVAPPVLTEVLATHDPAVMERGAKLYDTPFGPGDSRSYARQSLLVRALQTDSIADRLLVEETVLQILERVMGNLRRMRRTASSHKISTGARERHEELCQATRARLIARLDENVSVGELARDVGCSEYHLCRVFRQYYGTSMTQARRRLRLVQAWRRVLEERPPLTPLALELGFSSHSHLAAAFRREFGLTPRDLRRAGVHQLL